MNKVFFIIGSPIFLVGFLCSHIVAFFQAGYIFAKLIGVQKNKIQQIAEELKKEGKI